MPARLATALALVALAFVLPAGSGASPSESSADASARAVAVQVLVPESEGAAAGLASAPPRSGSPSSGFAYPGDGSIVSIGAVAAAAGASPFAGTARAASEAVQISIFGGEITADRIKAAVRSTGTTGDLADSGISNLVALGQSVGVAPSARVPLADWGYLLVSVQSTQPGPHEAPSFSGSFTGLVVHVDVDHGGLRAGSEIRIGFAEASGRAPLPEPEEPTTTQASTPQRASRVGPQKAGGPQRVHRPPDRVAPKKRARAKARRPLVLAPPNITPKLTAGGYVFPVYGPSAFTDTFRAPRGDVSGGWHHGEDIFAPLGAPVLAVADGTVFSVGWNDIGGYRLWLRDRQGNEFYYAHLSAYTTLAVDGAHVKAGAVLAFIGNSGDAQGTPYHLHFEIHPVSLLFMGYDGAVRPYSYLTAWKRLEDVRILPAVVGAPPPIAPTSKAPTPGAILLESTDISTASGLEPGALSRALSERLQLSTTGIGGLPAPVPVLDRA